jgi:hypothetical protein
MTAARGPSSLKGIAMARRSYRWTEKKIERRQKEARGKSVGADYVPWLFVSDVPSLGRVHRVFWSKTGREHHLMSDNEYFAFLRRCFEDDVTDIREQYPLGREETMEIAAALGVRHPSDCGVPIVMTTDLLVTKATPTGDLEVAYTVKEDAALLDARTIEKLHIERTYWDARGIETILLISSRLKNRVSYNLAWIFEGVGSTDTPRDDTSVRAELKPMFDHNPQATMHVACSAVDARLEMDPGSALEVVRRMIGQKEIIVDLDVPLLVELPCSSFTFADAFHER